MFQVITLFFAVAWGQLQPSTTPVPILKQINRQNDDGSYSYGYENADGSYKIETKFNTGEVYGKYGYVDAEGKLREVEYGATKRGFEPAGTGIDVPPPTLVNDENALQNAEYDDGQYREDPSIYWKTDKFNSVPAKPATKSSPAAPAPAAAPSRQSWSAPQQQARSWTAPQQAQNWNVAPQQNWNFAPAAQPVPSWQAPQRSQWEAPQPTWAPPQQRSWVQPQQSWQAPVQQSWAAPQQGVDPNLALFVGHPAKNFDLASGSYSISYNG